MMNIPAVVICIGWLLMLFSSGSSCGEEQSNHAKPDSDVGAEKLHGKWTVVAGPTPEDLKDGKYTIEFTSEGGYSEHYVSMERNWDVQLRARWRLNKDGILAFSNVQSVSRTRTAETTRAGEGWVSLWHFTPDGELMLYGNGRGPAGRGQIYRLSKSK